MTAHPTYSGCGLQPDRHGLNEKMTVLDIGARLGTTARLIAKETGAWVDGIEQNDALVEEAARLSAMEGLAK